MTWRFYCFVHVLALLFHISTLTYSKATSITALELVTYDFAYVSTLLNIEIWDYFKRANLQCCFLAHRGPCGVERYCPSFFVPT